MVYRFRYNSLKVIAAVFACTFIFISCGKSLSSDNILQLKRLTNSNTGPYLLQTDHLDLIDSLRLDSSQLSFEFNRLITGADSLLNVSFSYVTEKPKLPPSGDPHDYMSIHRYAYPDSTGAYTDLIDGRTNPEFYEYDKPKLERISAAVYSLSLAYYFTKDEKYALKASTELKNWFLNPGTRMNPNMNFSSIQWGVHEKPGGSGIVGALDFIDMIESASLLYDSPHWTADQHFKLKEWFFEFYIWLHNNYPPQSYGGSNVSTWLDAQRVIYLLFTEQENHLNSSTHIEPVSQRIGGQFESNGGLPREASRAIPQHYVYFNLKAYMYLSLLRKNHYLKTGDDRDWPVLKDCATADCTYGGLKAALDNVASYIQGANKATLFNSDPGFNSCRYLEIFRPAATAFESAEYEQVVNYLVEQNHCRNSNILLAFPAPF